MDKTEAEPTKQKSRLRITHAQNDVRYVEVGKLLHLTKASGSDEELEGMNMKKNGRPYSYPDTVIMAIAGIRAIHGPLSYRMCQGMAISALGEEDAPDHVTLWRRIKAMKVLQEGRDLIRYYFSSLPTPLFRPASVRLPVLPTTTVFGLPARRRHR